MALATPHRVRYFDTARDLEVFLTTDAAISGVVAVTVDTNGKILLVYTTA